MESDRAASDQGSVGEELIDDILVLEPTGAAPEASVPEVQAIAAASSHPSPQGSAVPASKPDIVQAKKKRAKKPAIDLDAAIRDAATAMKAAQKKVQEAKTQAKNERRKKQRLLKKAASLNAEDLERIAVLKRCGWTKGGDAPDLAMASRSASAKGSAASRLSSSAAACPDAPMAKAKAS